MRQQRGVIEMKVLVTLMVLLCSTSVTVGATVPDPSVPPGDSSLLPDWWDTDYDGTINNGTTIPRYSYSRCGAADTSGFEFCNVAYTRYSSSYGGFVGDIIPEYEGVGGPFVLELAGYFDVPTWIDWWELQLRATHWQSVLRTQHCTSGGNLQLDEYRHTAGPTMWTGFEDGFIDGLDIAAIKAPGTWMLPSRTAANIRADVNGDGQVNGLDIAAVKLAMGGDLGI
jgi:hypothetical protein